MSFSLARGTILLMRVWALFLVTLMAFFTVAVESRPARAQERVIVRGGDHAEYSRLVFEGPSPLSYSIERHEKDVVLSFDNKKDGVMFSGFSGSLKSVTGIAQTPPTNARRSVVVSIVPGSVVKDFTVGNKVVLDIYPPATKSAQAPKPKQSTTKPAAVTPPAPSKSKQDFSIVPAGQAVAVPTDVVEVQPIQKETTSKNLEKAKIVFASTRAIGAAAYLRHGYLWFVVDSVDGKNVQPEWGPAEQEAFGDPIKVPVSGGMLYGLKIPSGYVPTVTGKTLSWTIGLSSLAKPKPKETLSASSDNGVLKWTIPSVRHSLRYQDPFSGDRVNAVTVTESDGAMRPPEQYIDADVLAGYAGIAFVPKRDGVDIKTSSKSVELGRDNGLALSPEKDLKARQIRAQFNEPPKTDSKTTAADENAGTHEADTSTASDAKAKEGHKAQNTSMALDTPPPATTPEHITPIEAHPVGAVVDMGALQKSVKEKPTGNNIYNFKNWEMGGIQSLNDNIHALKTDAASKKKEEQTEDIITMAKLYLASNRAPEALGFLHMAEDQVPELDSTADFNALRGTAQTLSGKYDEAIETYNKEMLAPYDDVKYWKAYTLAGLEDWKQAGDVLPKSVTPIESYPSALRVPLLLTFSEIALRNGDKEKAGQMMSVLQHDLEKMPLSYASSWKYLSGELAKQNGDAAKAQSFWEPLVKNSNDDLYRAKAGLSLTRLELEQKKIKPADAINRLEGLRYAWRGDELETLINYRLGQLYIDNGEYLKGLTVLRNAATLTPDLAITQDVKDLIQKTFDDVFKKGTINKMSPIDAISFYQEFKDLTPSTPEGQMYVEKLAERLVDADLLGRAAVLLEYQMNNKLRGAHKADVAIRLAAIRLLDGNPDGALRALEIAQATIDKPDAVPAAAGEKPKTADGKFTAATKKDEKTGSVESNASAAIDPEKQRQVYLLKARALSMKKKPDDALTILEAMRNDPDVNRLRTDIAWLSGKWEHAAMSLNDLIVEEDVSAKRPLTDYQRDLILNRAIALNLSGNRVALANMRERFGAQMKDTTKGQMFDVVTRSRQEGMIESRQAISSMMAEIDLFKGFLDSYAKTSADDKKN